MISGNSGSMFLASSKKDEGVNEEHIVLRRHVSREFGGPHTAS